MSIKSILSTKDHYIKPFEIKSPLDGKTVVLSKTQKVASVGLGILIGAFTFGIGGVAAFYISTAAFKSWKLKNQPHVAQHTPQPQVEVKGILRQPGAPKKRLNVNFGQARARVFDKFQMPAAVANTNSYLAESFHRLSGSFTNFVGSRRNTGTQAS